MTDRMVQKIRREARSLEQESIELELSGRSHSAAEQAEAALRKMETVAKIQNKISAYRDLVSASWNYLNVTRVSYPFTEVSAEAARVGIQAQKSILRISNSLAEKRNLAGICRDGCIYLGNSSLSMAEEAVSLAEELVKLSSRKEDRKLLGTCYARRGEVLTALGQYDSAQKDLDRATLILSTLYKDEPWDWTAAIRVRCMYIAFYLEKKMFAAAKAKCQEAISFLRHALECCKPAYYATIAIAATALFRFFEKNALTAEEDQSMNLLVQFYRTHKAERAFKIDISETIHVAARYVEQLSEKGELAEAQAVGQKVEQTAAHILCEEDNPEVYQDFCRTCAVLARQPV
ncbi:MAG: hypothetical protein U0K37_04275 [Acutalibacteraceae bacterium]|nr:hypothetical protein [Acutalibacteraceae bacterium]